MRFRRQLPVYSPLSAGALLSGAGALLGGAESARAKVTRWLEQEWGTTNPLLTDSGTTALTLAMMASQQDDRTGVALPAYGCYDLVTAALGARVPVRWYDLDPATLGPDWSSLEAAVGAGVGAVVIAHYYGVPVDLEAAREVSRRHGALIVEDAAQGIGGTFNDRPLGATGDLGVLSFGRGKGLTGGSGGALLTNTESGRKAFARLEQSLEHPKRGLRSLVATGAQWLLARPAAYALPSAIPSLKLGETVFREPEKLGEIDPVALGILGASLGTVVPEAEARRANASWFIERLGANARVPASRVGRLGYLRFPVILGAERRKEVNDEGIQSLGVQPGYPRVLNALPVSTASAEIFKGAAELVESLVTVPVHSKVTERDREQIVRWLNGQEER